jgi:hypothetical protein
MAMTGVAAKPPGQLRAQVLHIVHTFLCLGLNLVIGKVRRSRYARYVIALLVLNEIRGLYVVYTAADHALPWLS